jgi:hypothetical protein
MRYIALLVERQNPYFANYAKYVQQTTHISICAVLSLKRYASNIFRIERYDRKTRKKTLAATG